eukprot:GILK01018102.1.p2 GENE.GILK01018102.1~~GILK01018102.1.p2  ORF type:complete len:184 (-),score=13.92 GILK01018102.1:337-888(-)
MGMVRESHCRSQHPTRNKVEEMSSLKPSCEKDSASSDLDKVVTTRVKNAVTDLRNATSPGALDKLRTTEATKGTIIIVRKPTMITQLQAVAKLLTNLKPGTLKMTKKLVEAKVVMKDAKFKYLTIGHRSTVLILLGAALLKAMAKAPRARRASTTESAHSSSQRTTTISANYLRHSTQMVTER